MLHKRTSGLHPTLFYHAALIYFSGYLTWELFHTSNYTLSRLLRIPHLLSRECVRILHEEAMRVPRPIRDVSLALPGVETYVKLLPGAPTEKYQLRLARTTRVRIAAARRKAQEVARLRGSSTGASAPGGRIRSVAPPAPASRA